MAQEITLFEELRAGIGFDASDPDSISSLNLAFVGDAVYELILRSRIANECGGSVGELNDRKKHLANAPAQSKIIESLLDSLTEKEMGVYKRGRNVKSISHPKNCNVSDYRRATGFEALIGYLYLTGQDSRMLELIKTGMERYERTE